VHPGSDLDLGQAQPLGTAVRGWTAFLRALIELGKPRVTAMVIFTFGGGLLLAPGQIVWAHALTALVGTTLIVAAANAINMYLERDVDGLMRRTRRRPLPEGRLSPMTALAAGAMLGSAALPLLFVGGGFLVAALGLLAFYSYVWGYTPLKRKSPIALYVGAVPGAMPPLMGWATATGRLDAGGLALFLVLFVWQIPHFIAIAIFRAEDYAGAGFRVHSLERSPRSTRAIMMISSLVLVASTLLLCALGVANFIYGAIATGLGVGFLAQAWNGMGLAPDDPRTRRWARGLFFYSLIYLTALFVALAVDRMVLGHLVLGR
jgi:protoheme IX farnesyltransferase